jgi:DNA-directed RNA polymerase subunit RPC12/RpoP
MKDKQFILSKVWSHLFKKNVYNVTISNIVGDATPEVIGVSYSNKMKTFSIEGKQLFSMPFDSEITQFRSGNITGRNSIDLISGDIHGYLRIMGMDGREIWKTNLKNPVISMSIGERHIHAGKSIMLGLKEQKLVVVNNRGEIEFEVDTPSEILDVTFGSNEENVIVLLANGNVVALKENNSWKTIFQADYNPTCFTFVSYNDFQGLLIGDETGTVRLHGMDGELITETYIGLKIGDIDEEFIQGNGAERSLFVLSAGKEIFLFEIKNNKNYIQKKEVSKKRFADIIKCPECGANLNPDHKKQLSLGENVYCEYCGIQIKSIVRH